MYIIFDSEYIQPVYSADIFRMFNLYKQTPVLRRLYLGIYI